MPSDHTYRTLTAPSQIVQFLEARARFLYQSDPVNYAHSRLQGFSNDDLISFASDFRVTVTDVDIMSAGCFVGNGGWLQDVFFDATTYLNLLLRGLYDEGIAHSIHLGSYTPSRRQDISQVCLGLNYQQDIDYTLHLNLLEAADVMSSSQVITWQDNLDQEYAKLYTSLLDSPYPWDVIKHEIGGTFHPSLWLMDANKTALLGINEASTPSYDQVGHGHAVFNIVVSAGAPDTLSTLLAYSLQHMSRQAPMGIVNAHARRATLTAYQTFKFTVVDETPIFTSK